MTRFGPRILVVGATGALGGRVVRHLLTLEAFTLRALTRTPDSEAARRLAGARVEIACGDLGDRASLRAALRDCYGVFATLPCASRRPGDVHARNLLNAVAGAEIEHFVFGTDPRADADVEAYARGLELPVTFVHVIDRGATDYAEVVAAAFVNPHGVMRCTVSAAV